MLDQFRIFLHCSALLQACSSGQRFADPGKCSAAAREDIFDQSDDLSMVQLKARAHVTNAPDASPQGTALLNAQADVLEGSDCDLCNTAQQWVFILSPGGRTGSSTIVTMLNAIPGFYIAGENDGIVFDMPAFYNKTFGEEPEDTDGVTPRRDPLSDYNILCSLQSVIRASIGGRPHDKLVLGFKEIRYHNKEQLDFLKKIFPCARFVINVRQNMTALAESQIHAYGMYDLNAKDTESILQANEQHRAGLEGWAQTQGDNIFHMPLEDFNLNRFNVLLHWLGVSNCRFERMAHANANQWYSKSLEQVPVYKECGIHGSPGRIVNAAGLFIFPQKNVVTCACDKCGSTSMYKFVYKSLFGKDWKWWNWPWPQEDVQDPDRWEGQRRSIDPASALALMEKSQVFSYALIRDPKERLISSWKSKVSCDADCWKTDTSDREKIVPELLATVGNLSKVECLSFDEFIDTLHRAHSQGKAGILNNHFIPQHLDCFLNIPMSKWSKVIKVSDPEAAKDLGAQLGNKSATDFPIFHYSRQTDIHQNCTFASLDRATAEKLEAITKAEYDALGLKRPA